MLQRQRYLEAPMIIAMASEKGGAEKSILAANLAALRASDGRKVLLLDADVRQSSRAWSEKRCIAGNETKVPARRIAAKGVEPELENLRPRYDDIVIDTEGRDCLGSRSALVAARIAIIPICPDQLNAAIGEAILRRIETARLFNPALQVLFVVTCAHSDPSPRDINAVRDLVAKITSARLAGTMIHESTSLHKAFGEGQSVIEYRPTDAESIAEMQSLYREVFDARPEMAFGPQ